MICNMQDINVLYPPCEVQPARKFPYQDLYIRIRSLTRTKRRP